jgi:tetrahydromethanopterin S-methyltransferase subunit A
MVILYEIIILSRGKYMTSQQNIVNTLYPWGGDFTQGHYQQNIALVLLNIDYVPSANIAIYGKLKTENIGIEKIIANVISNPFIRFLLICGEEIRGHRSGKSLICLHKFGIDENNRIIKAPGAIPYIENINKKAIERFQRQIQIIDLIGTIDPIIIDHNILKAINSKKPSFGKPFIAIQMIKETKKLTDETRALHSKIKINYMGKIEKRM